MAELVKVVKVQFVVRSANCVHQEMTSEEITAGMYWAAETVFPQAVLVEQIAEGICTQTVYLSVSQVSPENTD